MPNYNIKIVNIFYRKMFWNQRFKSLPDSLNLFALFLLISKFSIHNWILLEFQNNIFTRPARDLNPRPRIFLTLYFGIIKDRIRMSNEGLCTKTVPLNRISYHLTRGCKKIFLQDLRQVYQNRLERHLTIFLIDWSDLALFFITSMKSIWQRTTCTR